METLINTTKAVPVVLPIADWAELGRQAHASGRSRSAILRDLVAVHLRGKPDTSEAKSSDRAQSA